MLSNTLNTIFLMALTVAAAPAAPEAQLETRGDMKNCDNTNTKYGGRGGRIRKCWWDYFLVSTAAQDDPWQIASGKQYCAKGGDCAVSSLTGQQTCQSKSTTVSADVGLAIEGLGTASIGVSTTNEKSKCNTASDTSQCTWHDGGCHVVWTQQQMVEQKGYRRQRCNYGHGEETQCMADWNMRTPTKKVNYGCGSSCDDSNTCGNTNGKPC
ncbi:hypothetical protein PG988_014858 [Apiospora saccharicola]